MLPLGLFCLAAVALTWPLATDLSGVCGGGDPQLSIWILNYELRQLATNPLELYNAPIFFPYLRTLALTDSFHGLLPIYAPALMLTGDVVAAYSLIVIGSFAACAFAAFLLCRFGVGLGRSASFFAGIAYGFCHYRFDHLGHVALLWTPWIPAALLLLILYGRKPSWTRALLVGLFFLLQTLSSLYMGFFLAFLLAITWFFIGPPVRRGSWVAHLKPAAVLIACLVLLLPVFSQYFLIRAELGIERDYRENLQYSADLKSLLAPSRLATALHAPWLSGFRQRLEGGVSLGLLPMLAGAVGAALLFKRKGKSPGRSKAVTILDWSIAFYYLLMAASVIFVLVHEGLQEQISQINIALLTFSAAPILSLLRLRVAASERDERERLLLGLLGILVVSLFLMLGPEVRVLGRNIGFGLYGVLYHTLPLIAAFRVSARWVVLATLSIAVLAAFALDGAARRLKKWQGASLSFVLILLTAYEFSAVPLPMPKLRPYDAPVYRWLAAQQDDFAVLEYPVRAVPAAETDYMMSQLIHGKKLINGYSGFVVDAVRALAPTADYFPGGDSLGRIRTHPFRYMLVHTDRLRPRRAAEFEALLGAGDGVLSEVRRFGDTVVVAVDKGGAGKGLVMIYPRAERRLRFQAGALKEFAGEQYLALEVNGSPVGEWPIGVTRREIEQDLSPPSAPDRPTELRFLYRNVPAAYTNLGRRERARLNLLVETGGADPNHCLVGVNGAHLPRSKGYNLYLISREGDVPARRGFNTSWRESESAAMAEFISGLRGSDALLLIVTRYDASRSLTVEAVTALKSMGLKGDLRGREFWNHIALVSLARSRVILEFLGPGQQALRLGDFDPATGFAVDSLRTSQVPD